MIFDFNTKKKKGIAEIIYGKGVYLTGFLILFFTIFICGFIFVPWKFEVGLIVFKILALFGFCYSGYIFHNALIKISLIDNKLSIKKFIKEEEFLLEDVDDIDILLSQFYGLKSLIIKTKFRRKKYIIWAPRHNKERNDIFIKINNYFSKKFSMRNGNIT